MEYGHPCVSASQVPECHLEIVRSVAGHGNQMCPLTPCHVALHPPDAPFGVSSADPCLGCQNYTVTR